VSVELQDADGAPMLPQPLAHSVRLPTRTEGSTTTDFGLIRSFTFNNLVFRSQGSYSFVISVDDEPVSRLRFSVKSRPAEGDPA
jgi:hypothetical protein